MNTTIHRTEALRIGPVVHLKKSGCCYRDICVLDYDGSILELTLIGDNNNRLMVEHSDNPLTACRMLRDQIETEKIETGKIKREIDAERGAEVELNDHEQDKADEQEQKAINSFESGLAQRGE